MGYHQPHPAVDKHVTEVDAAAIHHMAGLRIGEATTTKHAKGGRSVVAGIVLRRAAAVVLCIPVQTPFIYVTAHVIQADFVGMLRTDGVSLIVTVPVILGHIAKGVRAAVFVATTILAATCSIFPFDFRGQAERLTVEFGLQQLVKFHDERLAFIPR